MSGLSPEQDARARDSEALTLKRLLSVGQKTVADAIGVSESTVSRWKEGEIERWCRVLALLGLRIVPSDVQCHPPQYIQALKTLDTKSARPEGNDHSQRHQPRRPDR
jgi:transcriptional regulator with XRE-family HTH domain